MNQKLNPSNFLQWWWHGLKSPWLALVAKPEVIRVTSKGIEYRSAINANKDIKLSRQHKSGKAYLLAPIDKVISVAIPANLKTAALADIAESLLPFDSHELHIAADRQRSRLYTIAIKHSEALISQLTSAGKIPLGVAFEHGQNLVYSDIDPRLISAAKTSKPGKLSLSLVSIIVLTCGIITFAWLSESARHKGLLVELQNLQKPLAGSPAKDAFVTEEYDKLLSELNSLKDWPISRSVQILQELVQRLPAEANVTQLILQDDEVVLDGSALSATEIVSSLDQSNFFTSSEFITAISSNGADKTERFRVKTSITPPETAND